MKPVWSHKKTKCQGCNHGIFVGEHRLDDIIKTRSGLVTLHYHPTCAWNLYIAWWDNNPFEKPNRQPKERSYLNQLLTKEQLEQRRKLVNKLIDLRKHYTINKPILPTEGKRLARYEARLQEYLLSLIPLGGIPNRYKKLGYTEENVCKIVKTSPPFENIYQHIFG